MKKFLCLAITLLAALMPVCSLAQSEQPVPEEIAVARDIYSWFVMTPLEVNEDMPSPDGDMYRLADESLSKTDEMQRRLSMCFSTEICQSLWAWGAYQDIDGLLYGYKTEDSPFARETDPAIVSIVYKLVSQTDKKKTYTAIVYVADSETTFRFVSEYISGRWIFTEFPYIW